MTPKPIKVRELNLDDLDNFVVSLAFFVENAKNFGWSDHTIDSARKTLEKISFLKSENAESIILNDANALFAAIYLAALSRREAERSKSIRPPT